MKKRFMGMAATALSALMIAPLFAACGQGGDDIDFDENGNVIPSDKTTIINFWGWADKYEEAVFNKLVSNFNEKYHGRLLDTSPSPRDPRACRMPLSGFKKKTNRVSCVPIS